MFHKLTCQIEVRVTVSANKKPAATAVPVITSSKLMRESLTLFGS